jgi:dimethylargininase
LLKNEGDRLTKAMVCSPRTEYFKVADFQAHNILEVADPKKAAQQHAQLRSVLENFGIEAIDIGELSGHPNSVFTRDMAVATSEGYIKMNMGIDTRRGEEDWMAQALDAIGEPCIGEIKKPGMVEGGDVIIFGSVVFVGQTQRTNEEGIRQLAQLLKRMNYEVRVAKLPDSYLHLDQVIGILGPERLIYCKDVFLDDFFYGIDAIEISCKDFNVNFICLGENDIIAPAANIGILKAAQHLGVTVRSVDLSEFGKGAGGPNCLIMPVDRNP